jgi:hypothetical protein
VWDSGNVEIAFGPVEIPDPETCVAFSHSLPETDRVINRNEYPDADDPVCDLTSDLVMEAYTF